jgi:hypothetical protein
MTSHQEKVMEALFRQFMGHEMVPESVKDSGCCCRRRPSCLSDLAAAIGRLPQPCDQGIKSRIM